MTVSAKQTPQDLQALIQAGEAQFRQIAPQWLDVNRMAHLALQAFSRNPGLLRCTKDSIVLFCMRCAETGLEPIGAGGAWPMGPFKNRHTGLEEVVFVPDWRGLISLAKREGQIVHAYTDTICENDAVDYQKGDNPRLDHKPPLSNRGEMIGAYCVAVLPDGFKHIEYMDKAEIDGIRDRSKKPKDGPWITDYREMAKKTVVKRALKPFAASPQMQAAVEYDNAAVGLDLPDLTPIAEPKAIAEAPKKRSRAAKAKAVEPPPTDPPAEGALPPGEEIVELEVSALSSQEGDGWRRFYFTVEGKQYSTFSDTLADDLSQCAGTVVPLHIKHTPKGTNILAIIGEGGDAEGPEAAPEPPE